MTETGLYTVSIAIVGSMSVDVHAESQEEALAIAEGCASPLMATEWSCWADEVTCFPSQREGYLIQPD